jgi:4-deoxy-L-threo-5-hexosulose-uronate ketol-isomerase
MPTSASVSARRGNSRLTGQRAAISLEAYPRFRPDKLKAAFVLDDLFRAGRVTLHHWETDRTIIGGIVPTRAALPLVAPPAIRAEHFNDRRETGIVNLGGPGHITVGGKRYAMGSLDTLYVGRGAKQVVFASNSAKTPARYYLVSYPAHAAYPTKRTKLSEIRTKVLGAPETENHRILHQVISPIGIPSCQLVMGFTLVQPGSKWNTMPPHTHDRRSEVYCYFGFPRGGSVKHFLGHPKKIRTVRLREGEAVLSPPWSVHSGEGSTHYGFVWAMGGENQDWGDMDPVDPQVIYQAR